MSEPQLQRLGQMRLRQLQLIDWLAGGATLRSCAERLSLTPAAVTAMLQEIESALGAALFARERSGAVPTPAGARLAEHARVLVREWQRMEQQLASAAPEVAALSIGLIPQVHEQRLPALVRAFHTRSSALLDVRVDTSQALIESVRQASLGGAVVRLEPGAAAALAQEGLLTQTLGWEEVVIAVPREHALARKRAPTLDQLAALQWALPGGPSYIRRMLEARLSLAGEPPPKVVLQVPSTVEAVRSAARLGLAVAGPKTWVTDAQHQNALKPLSLELGAPVELAWVYRASGLERSEQRAWHEALEQVFPERALVQSVPSAHTGVHKTSKARRRQAL
jgi:DNA-binding transcriptional LysR family regulator